MVHCVVVEVRTRYCCEGDSWGDTQVEREQGHSVRVTSPVLWLATRVAETAGRDLVRVMECVNQGDGPFTEEVQDEG